MPVSAIRPIERRMFHLFTPDLHGGVPCAPAVGETLLQCAVAGAGRRDGQSIRMKKTLKLSVLWLARALGLLVSPVASPA